MSICFTYMLIVYIRKKVRFMKKSKIISIRLGQNEYETIKNRATEKQISTNKFIVNSALSFEGIDIETKRKIYTTICHIRDYAAHNSKEKISEECEKLWQYLS